MHACPFGDCHEGQSPDACVAVGLVPCLLVSGDLTIIKEICICGKSVPRGAAEEIRKDSCNSRMCSHRFFTIKSYWRKEGTLSNLADLGINSVLLPRLTAFTVNSTDGQLQFDFTEKVNFQTLTSLFKDGGEVTTTMKELFTNDSGIDFNKEIEMHSPLQVILENEWGRQNMNTQMYKMESWMWSGLWRHPYCFL